MTVVAEFTVPSDAFRVGRVLGVAPDYSVSLVELVPTGDDLAPYFWVESDRRGFAAFEERVRDDDAVASLTALDARTDRLLYRIEWAERTDGPLEAFRRFDARVETATGTTDEWRFRALYGDHDAISEFREFCVDRGVPLSVERVYSPTPPDEDPAYGLTADQQVAIRLAFEGGYFEVPRGVTMTELGEELDISRQAVSNRLRRGLNQLVSRTIGGE